MERIENKIQTISKKYNGSFYIYDEATISRQADILLEGLSDFEFLYSIKTNPYQPIVNFLAAKGFGADAASAREVEIAKEAGISYERILYSTPGKTRRDIETSIDKSIIIADSYNELILINDVAKERQEIIKVGLRINLNFGMDGGGGASSKFGVDEVGLIKNKGLIDCLENIRISGIHVHLRSQVLDYKKLFNYYKKIFNLSLYCSDTMGWGLDFINFGGGLGIVYSEKNDEALDIERLSKEISSLIQDFKEKMNPRLIIETGRFVICDAGFYISPIVDIKESMGTKYLIVEKTLNGFLRPSIGELLMNYSFGEKLKRGSEPLYTCMDAYDFLILGGDQEKMEKVTIVGSLCTATDTMARDIILAQAKIGDLLIVTKAGSYSYSLSPLLFSSHDLPQQFYIDKNGEIASPK